MKKTVVIGFVGKTLDQGRKPERWQRWRPTIGLLLHEDLVIDELVLLHDARSRSLLRTLSEDITEISPHTRLNPVQINIRDPWDFADVYAALYDFVKAYNFDTQHYHYLLHITTGTHVAQICWYLLLDAHYLPAKLIQTAPIGRQQPEGEYRIIDLDLSRYAALTQRFEQEQQQHWQQLKAQIATRNQKFNDLICEVEQVARRSQAPILIMGATGVGKSQLAKQIYALKRDSFQLQGQFVEINCATLRGDSAMSTLFGHQKGAFTGAMTARQGLLKQADQGILFLDEVGELGLDEQAMLLKALEEKCFYPVGSDQQIYIEFQLIAGTNRDLRQEVQQGRFREDLWARLNTWTFFLPSLKQRREDIAPNIDYELQRYATVQQRQLHFNANALSAYLDFAQSEAASWRGNFRDLSASINRMATLCQGGRIKLDDVQREIQRLNDLWQVENKSVAQQENHKLLQRCCTAEQLAAMDLFDRLQLQAVLELCMRCRSMAEAGRKLFAVSRLQRQQQNDSDRVKKYLAKFSLQWADIVALQDHKSE